MPQAVHFRARYTLHAVTADLVWPRDGDFPLNEELDYLVVVSVGSQHDRCDIGCKLGKLCDHHVRRNLEE